jgi:hypothetical protein
MNSAEVLRLVDVMHREKNIPKDVIFEGIQAAFGLGRTSLKSIKISMLLLIRSAWESVNGNGT